MIEPQEISILMFVLVESLKVSGTRFHSCRDGARGLGVDRPVSSRQHFDAEFDSSDE